MISPKTGKLIGCVGHDCEQCQQTQSKIEALQAEVAHWKANHRNRVDAARMLIERTDLPLERIKAYMHYVELQAEVEQLRNETCACRWDSDDNRIATCERHQGWLDVIAEWSDRARTAEAVAQSFAAQEGREQELRAELEQLRKAQGECQGCYAVAWLRKDGTLTNDPNRADGLWTPLYTHPAPEEVEAMRAEINEQCRLNGMGSEREARLMARVDELERELADKRSAWVEQGLHLANTQKERDHYKERAILLFDELERVADLIDHNNNLVSHRDSLLEVEAAARNLIVCGQYSTSAFEKLERLVK